MIPITVAHTITAAAAAINLILAVRKWADSRDPAWGSAICGWIVVILSCIQLLAR